MRVSRIALSAGLIAGLAVLVEHFRDAPANLRRYSMPSVGTYDLATSLVFRQRYDAIAHAIAAEAPTGSTIVDLGCGPGSVLLRVAALAPTLRLTGVDVDPEMIGRAQRKARRAFATDDERPTFVVADAAALPFADASVDFVVSSYAVHHLPDRHAARAEILRVLKPGGKAIIWDIVSPHGAPADTAPPADEPAHGHAAGKRQVAPPHHAPPPTGHAPAVHGAGALDVVRMVLRFGRIPAERYELVKPAAGPA